MNQIIQPWLLSSNNQRGLKTNNASCSLQHMDFRERLKQARFQAEMTQAALALASGVRQQMISKLESGKSNNTAKAVELALALGVTPEWLATGQGEMHPTTHVLQGESPTSSTEISSGAIEQTHLSPEERERQVLIRDILKHPAKDIRKALKILEAMNSEDN